MKTKNIPNTIRTKIIPDIKKKVSPYGRKDCVMWVMDGDRGLGKTTAALQIHREFDNNFNILKQISYEFNEIMQREMYEIPMGKGHHIDEIRFERMDARTKAGVMIKKVVKEIRPWQHFITLTTPDAHDVMDIFLKFADYYSFFMDNGTMLLLKKNPKIIVGNKFGLDVKSFNKIKDDRSFKKFFIKPTIKAKTYVGHFAFPQYTKLFNKKDYLEYNKLRMEMSRKLSEMGKKTEREVILESQVNRLRDRLDHTFNYSMTNLDTSIKTRMEMFNIPRQTEYRWRNKIGEV